MKLSRPTLKLSRLAAVLASAWLCGAGGCASNGKDPVTNAIDSMSPPKPGDLAREAFDLGDPDKRRRAVTLLSAAPFGGEPSYVKMYRLLIDDPTPTVRAACTKALGLHGQVEDVELVLRRLNDSNQVVRWEAAKALQKLHDPTAIEPLIKVLRDVDGQDEDTRMAAAYALGQYPDSSVYAALVGALDDPEYGVVQAGHKSLVTLTGQELGIDSAQWLKFADDNRTTLFMGQRPYVWQPFEKHRGFFEKIQFWKEYHKPAPRTPTGLQTADQQPATAEGDEG